MTIRSPHVPAGFPTFEFAGEANDGVGPPIVMQPGQSSVSDGATVAQGVARSATHLTSSVIIVPANPPWDHIPPSANVDTTSIDVFGMAAEGRVTVTVEISVAISLKSAQAQTFIEVSIRHLATGRSSAYYSESWDFDLASPTKIDVLRGGVQVGTIACPGVYRDTLKFGPVGLAADTYKTHFVVSARGHAEVLANVKIDGTVTIN